MKTETVQEQRERPRSERAQQRFLGSSISLQRVTTKGIVCILSVSLREESDEIVAGPKIPSMLDRQIGNIGVRVETSQLMEKLSCAVLPNKLCMTLFSCPLCPSSPQMSALGCVNDGTASAHVRGR
ncbi:hypothetical protein BLNAU_12382 [Blattamonas nauphoetae]|uniref:Uncharacterized protein n=1 Tax=Blattamonas nauphoetae TaxID=2049346 RepID=A0ABQ9XJY0_9EUKA|nr:hypothetical protein BLNAU_12382 [Blattamonas nauphoetae]